MCKICSICKIEKPLNDFYTRKTVNKIIYQSECKNCTKQNRKQFYNKHKPRILNNMADYYDKNSDKIKTKTKQYRQTESFIQRRNNRLNKTEIRLIHNLRIRVQRAVKSNGGRKHTKTINLLGCSPIELKLYLESKFLPGMSWDNYGVGYLLDDKGKPVYDNNGNIIPLKQWHIDHIKPCNTFDLTQESEQRKCFHYTNLQPLWAKDNLEKSKLFICVP